jgi:hypothetical protein
MKRLFAALSLLVVIPLSAHAQVNAPRDGNWWNKQDEVEKVNYLIGFFDGMDLGYHFSYWGIVDGSNGHTTTCTGEIVKSFSDYDDKFSRTVPNEQVADGLDAFYGNSRNRSIKIHDAVWLVLNSIAGTPKNELNKMIESYRKNASKD